MSTLKISAIQADLEWQNKSVNLQRFSEKISALKGKTEIVVLPEMFSTGFNTDPEGLAEQMDGPTVQWMKAQASNNRIILTGSLIIEEGGKYFNRLLWILPDGQMGIYDKRHLFAFAGEDEKYSSGNRRLIASVKGWKINLLVCYDLRFPVWARQSVVENGSRDFEYDVLIYVANWPDKRSHAWRTLLQARAIENQCYTVGVNRVGKDAKGLQYNGDSMAVDPMGEVLYQTVAKEEVFTCELDSEKLEQIRSKLPFWKNRDPFHILT
ncbi:MAG: nitrilase family protein [Chitinophagales bacterium]